MATFKKVVTESADDTIAQSTTGSAATLTTARAIALSGDVSGSANFDGSDGISIDAQLGTGSVATANIQNAAITHFKLGTGAVTNVKIADGAVESAKLDAGAVGSDALASNAVITAKISDGAVSEAKLDIANSAQDGYVLGWDGTNSDLQWVQQSIDLSNLPDMTAGWTNTADEFVVLDAGTQKRKLSSEIFGSNAFNSTTIPTNNNQITNGAGYTTNTGTVTSVGTGTGLSGTVTSSGNITLNFSALGTVTTWQGDASNDIDSIIVYDDSETAEKQAFHGDIPVSFFNNDASYVAGSRSLTAGNGLTGGGNLTANRSFAVGAGTGVTVNANDVAIGQDVATTADVDFATVTTTGDVTVGGDLTVSGATITTSTETLEIADNTLILNSDLGSGTAGVDAGFVVERGSSGDNAALFYDNSDASWKVGTSSTQALPSDGARIALQKVTASLDTDDTSVPVGGFQVAAGVAYVRTA